MQTHGCANQTHTNTRILDVGGCHLGYGGGEFHTNHVVCIFPRKSHLDGGQGERQGGPLTTGCYSAAVGMAGPAAKGEEEGSVALGFTFQPSHSSTDEILPFHRDVRRHVHTAETDKIFQIAVAIMESGPEVPAGE